jgi:hypothetical protein
MSKKTAVMAFVVFAILASPAFARDYWTQNHLGDVGKPYVGELLHDRGDDIAGFGRDGSGFGQWPADIVIDCFVGCRAPSPF